MTFFSIKHALLPLATFSLLAACQPLESVLEDDYALRPIEGELNGDLGNIVVSDEAPGSNATVTDDEYGFGRTITILADNDIGEAAMIMLDTDLDLDTFEPGTTLTVSESEVVVSEPGDEDRVLDEGYIEVIGCSGTDPDAWDTDLPAKETTITLDEGDGGLDIEIEADFEDEGELSAEVRLCDEGCELE